jgi:hypothetical protein
MFSFSSFILSLSLLLLLLMLMLLQMLVRLRDKVNQQREIDESLSRLQSLCHSVLEEKHQQASTAAAAHPRMPCAISASRPSLHYFVLFCLLRCLSK